MNSLTDDVIEALDTSNDTLRNEKLSSTKAILFSINEKEKNLDALVAGLNLITGTKSSVKREAKKTKALYKKLKETK